MKARYLTFFSYIGTKFRSSEKLWLKEGRNYPDPDSIQGLMELALLKVRPINYPNLTLSSRTDGGVHALNSCAHFDLEKHGENIYHTNYITDEMNKFFLKNDVSISVKKCLRVNDNFSARFNAVSRTYLYRDLYDLPSVHCDCVFYQSSYNTDFRLAVLKPYIEIEENTKLLTLIPIEEWKRCHFVRYKEFDIERFKEGAKYFVGYHDFTTFKKFDKLLENRHNRREIKSIDITSSLPCVVNNKYEGNNFNYWDIRIQGRAFVHNQIRRMIATLIAVAIGKLEPKDIQVMLQVPSKHSWHPIIQNCPPYGLYLCNVEYHPEDLIYNPDVNECIVSDKNISEIRSIQL